MESGYKQSRPHRSIRALFSRNDKGNVVTLFALIGSVTLSISGAAVDYSRWMMAKTHTARALDAAVLAGARALQSNNADAAGALAVAASVYQSNIDTRLPLASDTIQFVTAAGNTQVTALGDASLKTTLLGVVGISELPVVNTVGSKFPTAVIAASATAAPNLEVAVMLDVTGSMCPDETGPCTSGPKIDALKSAAKDLIGIVLKPNQSGATARVSLVPFSTRVRLAANGQGAAMMKGLTDLDATWSGWYNTCVQSTGAGGSETGGNWACQRYQAQRVQNWAVMPCVTDRVFDVSGSYDYTDAAPGPDRWLNGHDGTRMPLGRGSESTAATSSLGASSGDPANHWNFNDLGECADVAEGNVVVPLTSDVTQLTSAIDGLEAYGATAGALGTAFTWYTLSPNWSGIWPSASAPGGYDDLIAAPGGGQPKLRKVAILMTDGGYNTVRGWKDQDQQTVSDHAKQLCSNMKAAGIEIYTVGFALDQLTPSEASIAQDTLRACGSDISHFYDTLSIDQLKQAFRQIALSLSTVYLAE